MILTVLCDNNTYIDEYCLGEPAFCCLIEDGAQTVLCDVGYSDVFLKNADRLGVDLSHVTDIALSHGHNDHTGGLAAYFDRFRQPVRLYAHSRLFEQKRSAEGLPIGSPLCIDNLPPFVDCRLSDRPQRISEHITTLGEIPRRYEFERGREIGQTFHNGQWETDCLRDDTALALSTDNGLFLVSGCAHSGICNIVAYANEVLKQTVRTCLGGMHLFYADGNCLLALKTLHDLGVDTLYPCHCTGLAVKAEMLNTFETHEVGVSLRLEIPNGLTFPRSV